MIGSSRIYSGWKLLAAAIPCGYSVRQDRDTRTADHRGCKDAGRSVKSELSFQGEGNSARFRRPYLDTDKPGVRRIRSAYRARLWCFGLRGQPKLRGIE